jgi:hypothetical protein
MISMAKSCSTSDIRDIAAHGTRQSPSMAGVSGQVTSVHGSPGLHGTTGWAPEIPFVRNDQHPTPGVAASDRLLDHADALDRLALAKRVAEQKLAEKL